MSVEFGDVVGSSVCLSVRLSVRLERADARERDVCLYSFHANTIRERTESLVGLPAAGPGRAGGCRRSFVVAAAFADNAALDSGEKFVCGVWCARKRQGKAIPSLSICGSCP